MSNTYLTLKAKHQAQVDAFPIKFAFNTQQFEEAMNELGLTPTDTDKIFMLSGGGFIRKSDAKAFSNLFIKLAAEKQEAIAADTDGTGYIYDMFEYELGNHEYSYTHDPEPTLDALSLTLEEVQDNPIMAAAFKRAKAAQFKPDNTEQP